MDKLGSNLKDKGLKENKSLKDTFPTVYSYLKKKWSHLDKDAFELLCRKGVYPYEYFDSFERFNETKLPEKEKYYSTLTKKHITDEEYDFAKEVWEKFKLKNLGELYDLYMNTDVMIQAEVFESFRETALGKYKLDPAPFMTAPSLGWAAFLKKIDKSLIGEIRAMSINIAMSGSVNRSSFTLVFLRQAAQLRLGAVMK